MTEKVILLVDDDPDDSARLLSALEKLEIPKQVIVASNHAEALDYLSRARAKDEGGCRRVPDLILLALQMPRTAAVDLVGRVRSEESTRFVPIVILTSSAEAQDVLDGYSAGANSYICRPLDREVVEDVVRQLGFYWLSLNEMPVGLDR